MTQITEAADAMAEDAEGFTPPTPEEAKAAAESGEAEGTTPEEVAKTLRSSGINLPDEPVADDSEDAEEGDDPDAAEEGAASGEGTEEAAEEEAGEGAEAGESDEADESGEEEEAGNTDIDKVPLDVANADKYSFTVEDANGVTFKISAGDDLEKALAEFEPKNNGQALSVLNQFNKLEAQKAEDDAAEANQTAKAEQAQRISEIRKGWDGEIKDLTAQKRIPEGTDGEKRTAEVYNFMSEENDKRIKAGKPTIGSFEDALDKLELKESREAEAAKAKADKEDARKKGALVGGSSAPVTTATPVYRAGSARNAGEAIKSMGLI